MPCVHLLLNKYCLNQNQCVKCGFHDHLKCLSKIFVNLLKRFIRLKCKFDVW